jgi:hypothetical protein
MTTAAVDWREVERRSRAREPIGVLLIGAVFIGWAASTDHLVGVAGTAKWLLVGGYLLCLVGMLAASRLHPRLRTNAAAGHRMQYALRHHVDPGPELRERLDQQAAYLDRIVWFRWWVVFLIPAGYLMSARWDRPLVTVPAAIVVVGVVAWAAIHLRRTYAAAKRWVADPPGPARQMPSLAGWQRWASSWWFFGSLLAVIAFVIGIGVLLVLTR